MLKVLIADDEASVCKLLQSLVCWPDFGMEICGEARDGAAALEMIRKLNPELVLVDVRMPGVDGFQMIERAKKLGSGADFIMISGHRDFEYAQRALRYHVLDYLLKPIDKRELTVLLQRIRAKYANTEAQAETAAKPPHSESEAHVVRVAKKYIEEHFAQPVTLKTVADLVGFNSTYFSTRFRAECGQTFLEYLTDVRITKAKELLRTTNGSVASICQAVGYNDINHFNALFKKNTDLRPSVYRKLYS
ncbi:MAG: response regulator [Oscillospiraceae bacterium]|jgi:YesN/AraC family two-component response regulator|nr:response regulator [Oscillospiraceae bacterium]